MNMLKGQNDLLIYKDKDGNIVVEMMKDLLEEISMMLNILMSY